MKNFKLEKGRGYAYQRAYHIAWCTKDRQPVFDRLEYQDALSNILYSIADEKKFVIHQMYVQEDYVHVLLSCKPQHYVPDMVKALKGISARKLQIQLPQLQKKMKDASHIWDSSYMIVSGFSDVKEEIEEYILNYKVYRK